MAHIELRPLTDADRDAAFQAVHDSRSAWPNAVGGDRPAFDGWVDRDDVDAQVIVQDDDVVGVAAAMDRGGDREILLALVPGIGDEAPSEALRLLTAQEAERPLYACVAADDDPSHDLLARIGFVEHERDGDDVVYVLPPTLE